MRIPLILFTTSFLVLGQVDSYGQKKFELTDMAKLYTLTSPQLSPDGKSVLMLVSKPDTTTVLVS